MWWIVPHHVKFGASSTVSVMGKGSVTIQTRGNFTHTISNVLYVPNLKNNSLSISQLQEKGHEISIKDVVCWIQDAILGLIAQVNMMMNRIFPLFKWMMQHGYDIFSMVTLTLVDWKLYNRKIWWLVFLILPLPLKFVKNVLLANNTAINSRKENHGEQRSHLSWNTLIYVGQ